MILEDRLQQAASTLFEPAAIKICAAKVSKTVLGDARKALDICRGLLRRQQLEQCSETISGI